MASRFEQNKPDPAIKKNVRQARQRHQGRKYASAMVAGASVAATVMGWAFFSNVDASAVAQTQDTQYATTVTTTTDAQTTGNTTTTASATATPATSAQVISPITSTRSSR